MMVEITYQMVLSTLQTVSLMIGVIYYIFIMRNSQKSRELSLKAQEQTLETRQTQLLMQIYQNLSSETTLKNWIDILSYEFEDYEDFNKKYGSAYNRESFAKRYSVWRTLDGVGLLLRDGLLDVDRVYDLMDATVIPQWEKYGHIIKEFRNEGWPDAEEGFEYLYDEIMKVRKQRGIAEDVDAHVFIE